MQRIAFKMKLLEGCKKEYKSRHDTLWPELGSLLREKGIKDYSIFLDEETYSLFACLTIDDPKKLDQLSSEPLMKKWWDHMKDIMETNADHSPVSIPLEEVFYLS